MADEGLQGEVVCSVDITAPGKAQQAKSRAAMPTAEDDGTAVTPEPVLSLGAAGGDDSRLRPLMLVAAADMYSLEPKPASVAGGILTVLALMAAVAYTASQLVAYTRMPPVVTSYVEWADTQGPFPARIRCTAPSGCWISNRHNDIWSSHGDEVEQAQQGCLVLQPGQEYTMNFTFTKQPLNGFVAIWDPATWENDTTPGSGLQMLAETNAPDTPGGIFLLPTPVLGGTYLANFVETHNQSAPAAKLRHEWFITSASRDRVVLPAATPCAGQLTQQQLANYTQAMVRMQSAWYRVTVEPPDLLLTLVGNCGGALQLFLQAGFLCLLVYQFMRDKAFR
uniref:Uncharacterized protein n=1 Tax=Tetradesmus obliquus TaxID=3088 RepID=A0A383VED8_TETOB|eukprot:jgi/Sobl393_1/10434/SZX63561.1